MCPPGVCQRGRMPLGLFEIVAIISHIHKRCYCTRFGRWKRRREMVRRGDWYEGQCGKSCLVNFRMRGRETHNHEIAAHNGEEAKNSALFHSASGVEGTGDGLPTYDRAYQRANGDEKLSGYKSF